ncbi:MAG: hypothetical protein ACRDLS_03970, partial [Solirubrobacteraceae bacterium]
MADRFKSYLRRADELLRDGDLSGAAGHERLARQTLEQLGSPPDLAAKLHAQRGERALRQADYPLAEQAFAETVAALREAGGGGRELFDALHRLGLARAHQGSDERALEAFDEALAVATTIGPAFHSAASTHIARAESLRRVARRADAETSLRAAIALADHAPADGRQRIADAARRALDGLRPGSSSRERPRPAAAPAASPPPAAAR